MKRVNFPFILPIISRVLGWPTLQTTKVAGTVISAEDNETHHWCIYSC